MSASPITLEQRVDCQSDVCAIWKGLSDTEWLNRAMGNERLAVAPLAGETAARYLVTTRLGGFEVTWEEQPYQFAFMEYLKVRRDMKSGPIERLDTTYATAANGLHSTVTIKLELWPRTMFLSPIVRLSAGRSLNKLVEAVQSLDESLARAGRPPELPPAYPVNMSRLEQAAKALTDSGVGAAGTKLVDLVARGADDRVMRIRPYPLADEWKLPRRDVLGACLVAVQSGLLQLRWDVVCPSCRTGASAVDSLSQLSDHGFCQLCEIGFGLDFDDSVEATFRPVEGIRRVEPGPFCVGSPARMPHVVSQAVVPASGRAKLTMPNEEGLFRLFLRGGKATLVRSVAGAASELDVPEDGEPWPERMQVAPSGSLFVSANGESTRHVKLEKAEWASLAATARDVMTLPVFRRDFSAQVLKPGLTLSVQRVALVFSDLTGSTELYAQAGDAAAFRVVLAHFDVLQKAIERHGGSIVKTIGDAVMASFPDELSAFCGARDMLRDFEAMRANDEVAAKTSLKVGSFSGPGFVATANKVLDYFGQTVNVAARMQGEAKPGQLVVTEALAQLAIEKGLIEPGCVVERYEARLKGVEAALSVARLQVVTH